MSLEHRTFIRKTESERVYSLNFSRNEENLFSSHGRNTWKQAVRLRCILARFKIIMEYLRLSRLTGSNQFIQPVKVNGQFRVLFLRRLIDSTKYTSLIWMNHF